MIGIRVVLYGKRICVAIVRKVRRLGEGGGVNVTCWIRLVVFVFVSLWVVGVFVEIFLSMDTKGLVKIYKE